MCVEFVCLCVCAGVRDYPKTPCVVCGRMKVCSRLPRAEERTVVSHINITGEHLRRGDLLRLEGVQGLA